MQPEKTTLAQKLCLNDPYLKCPKHDEMSFILADPDCAVVLIRDAEPSLGPCTMLKTRLEFPLTKGEGKYEVIVGFIDALAIIEIPLEEEEIEYNQQGCGKIVSVAKRYFFIEAKPQIPNPMEVLRQLNTYRKFTTKRSNFLLWCPAIQPEVAEIFRQQKILISTLAPEEVKKHAGH
jgi:hypothetical protein